MNDIGAFVPSELCLAETCIDKVTANICEDTCSCCILESLGRRVSHASFYPCFASFFNMVGQCSGGAQKPFVKSVDFHGELLTIEVLGQDSSVVCTSVALESRLAKWDNHNLTLQIYENASFGDDHSVNPGRTVRNLFEKCVGLNGEFVFIDVFEACVSDVSIFVLPECCSAESYSDNVSVQICANSRSFCTLASLGRRVIELYVYSCVVTFICEICWWYVFSRLGTMIQ